MTIKDILNKKKQSEKISMLTAYDYNTAKIIDDCGVDIILLGDSLGTAFQGKDTTRSVTMDNILYHLEIVKSAVKNSLLVADMPFNSDIDPQTAILNAKKLINAGAQAVKLEGNKKDIIKALINEKIPVMGHLGLLPQTAKEFKVQGKDNNTYNKILEDAKNIENNGAFSLVLECVPENLSKEISNIIDIPTIGIGAGIYCDGQVLVINDLLGITKTKLPKFVKKYADLDSIINKAVKSYINDVKSSKYPDSEHTYH